MDAIGEETNGVNITITAPSDNEVDRSDSSDEGEDEDYVYSDDGEHSDTLSENSVGNPQEGAENDEKQDKSGGEDEEKLCEKFENGASLDEEKPAKEEKESSGKQNYEIVGDRVLVERDGKFELVDANEIKAEYFEMLGLKPEGSHEADSNKSSEGVSIEEEKPEPVNTKQRPKTTPVGGFRIRETQRPKRAQSSWGERYRNSEYAKIRSPYGLTDRQLEIKRKREEAIARRKKEEEERAREEEKRRREDAERAFQAWLNSKREEEKERRRAALQGQTGDDDEKKASESERAFKAWKASKKKQQQEEHEEAQRRMEETASMYVVHDRGECEEAFKRWLRKKKEDKKAKELEKKKKRRPKSRRKPKEPLPINSEKIRFTDNYGYRNTVVY